MPTPVSLIGLVGSLLLLAVGLGLRSDFLGMSSRHARLSARIMDNIGSRSGNTAERIRQQNATMAWGFIAIGSVLLVVNVAYLAFR